jgi:DNA-binding transcriptional LysR family regulator
MLCSAKFSHQGQHVLDLRQLRYFVAVAELENISRAAEALNITQSPLSRQIQDLEGRLRLKLFERVRQRVHLTGDGRRFLAEAKALLEASDRCERAAAALAAGETGPVRIGYVEAAVQTDLVGSLLAHLQTERPDLRVELRSLRSASQIELLRAGALDLGFTHSGPAPGDAQLAARRLVEEPFVIALAKGWFPVKGRLSESDLGRLPFIAPPEESRSKWRRDFLAACRTAGFEPDVRVEAEDLTTVLELVRSRAGAAVVQASVARKRRDGICFYPLPAAFPLRLQVYAVHRHQAESVAEPMLRWVELVR